MVRRLSANFFYRGSLLTGEDSLSKLSVTVHIQPVCYAVYTECFAAKEMKKLKNLKCLYSN